MTSDGGVASQERKLMATPMCHIGRLTDPISE